MSSERKSQHLGMEGLDLGDLRSSLLESTATPAEQHPARVVRERSQGGLTPEQVLAASPSVVRLCENFEHQQGNLRRRGRVQRIGLALLITSVVLTIGILALHGELGVQIVRTMSLVLGATGFCCVGLLAVLWMRDSRRLRMLQGERLVRALNVRSELSTDDIAMFLGSHTPQDAFFECFTAWKEDPELGQVASNTVAIRGRIGRDS